MSPALIETIEQELDNSYNLGIEHCIELIKNQISEKELSPLRTHLILKLTALKSKIK